MNKQKRLCTICKINEPRNKTASYCKSCANEWQKDFYKKNPRCLSKAGIFRKKAIRDLVKEKKDVPCLDCGISYPYYVMDYDHIKGVKKFNLSIAASKYRSMKSVLEEMEKCEIVCANCHRERTFLKIRESSSGRTNVSEALKRGSNPCSRTLC